MAQLESFHAQTEEVGHGHTVRLNHDPTMVANRRVAALFLRPVVSPALSRIPDCIDLAGDHVEFLMVVFLSDVEYQIKLGSGLDALLDAFERNEKDLAVLGAP